MSADQFIYIAFATYCSLFGIYDGIMWHLSRKEPGVIPKIHPHWPAFIMRVLVAGVFCLMIADNWMEWTKDLVALGAVLSFYHNGFYYETRRLIDKPEGYWFLGQSNTSTGWIELNGPVRTMLMIIGTLMYFYWEI